MFLVDSHCHLNLIEKDNLNDIIARAQKNNVRYLLNVSMNLRDFKEDIVIAESYPHVGAALGIHPNDNSLDQFDHLLNKAQHQKVVAIGETGLDYFQDSNDTAIQREYFRTHIRIAKQLKKPLIIHTRAAKKDTLAILHEENAAVIGGVFQCFNEDWETAKKAMDMNFYISFSGLISHLNNETLNRIAKSVPIDRILIETDSPFFAPSPFHETQNEPAFLPNIAAYLANLRDESLEEFANAVTTNFFHLFQKAKKPK